MLDANFEIWASDSGGLVPGSYRRGHNVFTDVGLEWLARATVWSSLSPDTAVDERRLRWLGLGSGAQYAHRGVSALVTPLTITTGPDEYIRVLGTRSEPTNNAQRFVTVFTGASADFDHHGASVVVSEAALYADVHDGVGTILDPSQASSVPVAYIVFDPVTKLQAQDLTITWELRF